MIEKGFDTATALADAANIERNTVSAILNGKRQPSLNIMYAIAEALDLNSKRAGEIFLPNPLHKMQRMNRERGAKI